MTTIVITKRPKLVDMSLGLGSAPSPPPNNLDSFSSLSTIPWVTSSSPYLPPFPMASFGSHTPPFSLVISHLITSILHPSSLLQTFLFHLILYRIALWRNRIEIEIIDNYYCFHREWMKDLTILGWMQERLVLFSSIHCVHNLFFRHFI